VIGIVGSLNQNINQLNQDMTRLGNGMGNLREDMQDLKTNFCYGRVVSGSVGGDSQDKND
jgi:hypothetical protein